ncbi:MAG: hypothetical protein RE471_00525 [Ferroplasma sp.]|uniref:hypothetical protein n=1 Tax=Ferroplasma sp. TaxID=2591003 RepID=UPI0028166F22|nr:hypothetical protein [Ferroplasma sp.]WMT51383.1 MAG: hypothetical protein RE471_00525 [Ferroplasma sp.]
MLPKGMKLLTAGLSLLIGGFGLAILSIYGLLPYASYTGVIGAAAFIIGLGLTALASTQISLHGPENNGSNKI